ncbi:MAG: class II aldolase/adducin family protein [Pseudomonadota bacterium]
MRPEHEIRKDIVLICRRLSERGFIAASDGNVSVRLQGPGGAGRLLITPSGLHKGFIKEDDLVLCDMSGKALRGRGKPSSEILMHLQAYQLRPDVNAVVHAHPPLATAFTIAKVSLARCVLPEVVITMGTIPTTAYATPCTAEGPEVIKDLIGDHDALVLDRHGTLTVGKDLFEAYGKLEKIEHTAQVTLAARMLGNLTLLNESQLARLEHLAPERVRRAAADPACLGCGACQPADAPADREAIGRLVAQELKRVLGGRDSGTHEP